MTHRFYIIVAFFASFAAAQTQSPHISAVTNAATFVSGPLAPGTIISIFGSYLTDGTVASTSSVPLPTRLAGATVLMNGFASPLFFVSPGQINAQVPVELSGATSALVQIEIRTGGTSLTSPGVVFPILAASPGIFTIDQSGTGTAVGFHPTTATQICGAGHLECLYSPVSQGEVISIYANGLGLPKGGFSASGGVPTSAVPVASAVTASIGGTPATVLFAGLTTNFVGVYQVNVLVPSGIPGGPSVPFVISVGGLSSNAASLPVAGPNRTALPDLSLTLTAAPNPVSSGAAVTYTALVQNIGSDVAPGARLTQTLPPGTTFVYCNVGGKPCGAVGSLVSVPLGELAPGSTASITIIALAPVVSQATALSSTATVDCTTNDADVSNNQVTRIVTLNP